MIINLSGILDAFGKKKAAQTRRIGGAGTTERALGWSIGKGTSAFDRFHSSRDTLD